MSIAYHAGLVDEHQRGHPSQLEYFDLLPVHIRDANLGVGKPNQRILMVLPMILERLAVVGPNDQNFGLVLDELVVILTQLHEMLAAVRSGKAAIKHEHDVLFSVIVRKMDGLARHIDQFEIRS